VSATTVRRALAQSGLVPIDAQVLLAHVLGRNRAWLAAHGDDALAPGDAATFAALAHRRRNGEPVAYLTGTREFRGLSFTVTDAVLIPRPETETLVEVALALLPADRDARVLDLGTGSGAITVSIASARARRGSRRTFPRPRWRSAATMPGASVWRTSRSSSRIGTRASMPRRACRSISSPAIRLMSREAIRI
jgi:hypothetical protein